MPHRGPEESTKTVFEVFKIFRHSFRRNSCRRVQLGALLQTFVKENRKRVAGVISFHIYSVLHLLLGLLHGLVKWITGKIQIRISRKHNLNLSLIKKIRSLYFFYNRITVIEHNWITVIEHLSNTVRSIVTYFATRLVLPLFQPWEKF